MRTVGFTGARIDRADAIRNDPERLADAMSTLSARLLRLDGIDPVDDGMGGLVWGSLAEVEPDRELLFLGMVEGKPRFAPLAPPGVVYDARSRTAWQVLGLLAPDQAALYAAARSLIDWHSRHRFCAQCGGATTVAKGGWQRNCGQCAAQHFPRTDPVVIMLAEYEGKALVGRQHGWPPGRYSALAGFVEPGESIEEAVTRELFEEAGVRAGAVRYIASQPWPFPSSLMIACVGTVEADDLTLDPGEIEDAFWVTRAEVAAALSGASDARFIAPPPFAIAHTLLAAWVEEGAV